MDDHILEMRGITKTFPGVKALEDVNLKVRRGEIHAICGENGAGKSTLMKVLSGVYPAGSYDGEIVYDGQPVRFSGIRDSEHVGIVIIHQELALVPYLSIAENIFLGSERRGRFGLIDWNKANAEAGELLRSVGLDENPVTPVGQLGVGKQQLVEITAVSDNVTVIRDGKTVETLSLHAGEVTQERIIRGMVGRDLESYYPERESHPGEEVLRVEDWTVWHPTQDRKVVDGASFTVRAGEVVGIAGLMGAGRTELAMSVFGRAYGRNITGRMLVHGKEVRPRNVSEAIDAGIAYATEDRKHYGLNLIEDIRRNVSAAALGKLASKGFVNGNEEIKVAEGYRKSMNVKAPSVASVVGKLSGGNQQKVVLSKWLYTDPEVLILDEPTRGIDVGAKYEIYTIINRLVAAGKAVLVISSELPELLGICDRIYTLSAGRITGEMPVGQATQENLMELMTKEKELAA